MVFCHARHSRTDDAVTYAKHTDVPVEKTKAAIEKLLAQHGATSRGVMQDDTKWIAAIAFVIKGAHFRVDVPLPNRRHFKSAQAHDQAGRSRWRLVLLALKSKLELVALGASTVEREFLASLLLPNGHTVQEDLSEIIRRGMTDEGPRMLGGGS
jgi:hypothetical protein